MLAEGLLFLFLIQTILGQEIRLSDDFDFILERYSKFDQDAVDNASTWSSSPCGQSQHRVRIHVNSVNAE
jgi:hypothetical protein